MLDKTNPITYGVEVDYYALGVSILEMATGKSSTFGSWVHEQDNDLETASILLLSPPIASAVEHQGLQHFITCLLDSDFDHKSLVEHPFLKLTCTQEEFGLFVRKANPVEKWWRPAHCVLTKCVKHFKRCLPKL